MKKIVISALASAVMLSGVTSFAYATDKTATFKVQIQVTDGCSVAADDINFGIYSSLNNPSGIVKQGKISVSCNEGAAYSFKLNGGNNISGTDQRQMASGAARVKYDLTNITDGASTKLTPTTAVSGTALDDTVKDYVIEARIPQTAGATQGTYSDTVQVTLTY
ncbi:Csu type fimbrial protein [Bartonella sp. LJL80]